MKSDGGKRSSSWRGRRALGLLAAVATLLLVLVVPVSSAGAHTGKHHPTAPGARSAAATAPDADTPANFWYGTDSRYPAVGGTAPYQEPDVGNGGNYGAYVGQIGGWPYWQGCVRDTPRWNAGNYAKANANHALGLGLGSTAYWMMAGPGLDPATPGRTPTATQAYAWGRAQAARVESDIVSNHYRFSIPVIFMDIEISGVPPAPDNGWNTVYAGPCGGRTVAAYIPAAIDREVFDGFADYVNQSTPYKSAVYSGDPMWRSIFGSGGSAQIPRTYEWTYLGATSSLATGPSGWCVRNTCAQFFGGQTSSSPYALAWQWSGGGGVTNGYGDFDQFDGNRLP